MTSSDRPDLMYLYCELRSRGILERYPKSWRDEGYRTLGVVIAETRLYSKTIVITRTSRQCFRVLYDGKTDNYRNYRDASDRVCALIDELEFEREEREKRWKRNKHGYNR